MTRGQRDFIRERVINGLKAAKERGVHIGRKKTRPSVLIRRLRSKGLTFREIANLANCSQGSVALEMKAWKKEQEAGIEAKNLDNDIQSELENPIPTYEPKTKEVEPPPIPISVIRY